METFIDVLTEQVIEDCYYACEWSADLDLYDPEVFCLFMANLMVHWLNHKTIDEDISKEERHELYNELIYGVNRCYDAASRNL